MSSNYSETDSNFSDGMIEEWAKQALDDTGSCSWRDIDTNSLILIVYLAQRAVFKRFARKIAKPLWWLLGVVASGSLWLVISDIFNL